MGITCFQGICIIMILTWGAVFKIGLSTDPTPVLDATVFSRWHLKSSQGLLMLSSLAVFFHKVCIRISFNHLSAFMENSSQSFKAFPPVNKLLWSYIWLKSYFLLTCLLSKRVRKRTCALTNIFLIEGSPCPFLFLKDGLWCVGFLLWPLVIGWFSGSFNL